MSTLLCLDENVEFQVFLPARMARLFPDENATENFLHNICGLEISSFIENNSVDLEFLNIPPPLTAHLVDDEDDVILCKLKLDFL